MKAIATDRWAGRVYYPCEIIGETKRAIVSGCCRTSYCPAGAA